MFPKSIRWRLQLWLAFLLVCILSGFGVTAYQLHRTQRFTQIDEELDRRVLALNADVRGRPPFGQPSGHPPFEAGRELQPPRRFGPGPVTPGDVRESRFRIREIQLSDQTLSLFDEAAFGRVMGIC